MWQRLWSRMQWTGHRGGGGYERPLPMGKKRAKENDDFVIVLDQHRGSQTD